MQLEVTVIAVLLFGKNIVPQPGFSPVDKAFLKCSKAFKRFISLERL